ncbi:MAG: hypothetical protein U0359_29030 [Byssovorax sp.]
MHAMSHGKKTWIARMTPLLCLGAGCSVGLDGLTFDREPTGGSTTSSTSSTTGTGGSGGAGGAGGSGSAGGSGGSAGSGGACAPIGTLSDDFSAPSTLSDWQLLTTAESTPPLHNLLDIGTTTPGQLSMRPMQLDMNGWFASYRGPFLYKQVTGNFLIAARVSAGTLANAGVAPSHLFNVAGVMARNPAGAPANWVLADVGYQNPADGDIANLEVGVLAKDTHNGNTTRVPFAGSHQGWIGICRIGATFGIVHRLDGEASTTILTQFNRPDLPAELQVGLVVGTWTADSDVVGRFDSVHFMVPSSPADCEACLTE